MLIEDYTPYAAFLHTFLLMLLGSIVLVGILFALNLHVRMAVGTIAVGMIYFLGMMIPPSWSYIKNAIFSYHMDHQLVLSHSYVFFILSILIVYFFGRARLSRVDFQLLERGEANDE